jgi:CRP-like cAMP-binding protein
MPGLPRSKAARKLTYLQNSLLGVFLSEQQLQMVAQFGHLKIFPANFWIYKQGESAEIAFLVGSGQVKLYIDNASHRKRASTLTAAFSPRESLDKKSNVFWSVKGSGNVVGQESFVYENDPAVRRLGSCKSLSTSECVTFYLPEVQEALESCEDKSLKPLFLKALGKDLPEMLAQTQLFPEQSAEFIMNNPVLWNMFRVILLYPDEVLFDQGSIGKAMYVIFHGKIDIKLKKEESEGDIVVTMNKNETFGEIGLLIDSPRSGSAISVGRSVLLELRSEEFNSLLKTFPVIARRVTEIARRNVVYNFRKYDIPFFQTLTPDQFNMLGDLATIIQVPPGEIIFDINEYGDRFYMVVTGDVAIFVPKEERKADEESGVEKDEYENMVEVCRIGAGRYFGELALVTDSPRCAAARSVTRCVLLSITRQRFEKFFETNPEAFADFQIKLAKYKISLSQLLAHPRGLDYFVRHCKSEYSVENIMFWKAVSDLEALSVKHEIPQQDMLSKCQYILDTYISMDSITQVNLAHEITSAIQNRVKSNDIHMSMFADAKEAIFILMERDIFNRFKSSPLFQEFLKEMEAYAYVQEETIQGGIQPPHHYERRKSTGTAPVQH